MHYFVTVRAPSIMQGARRGRETRTKVVKFTVISSFICCLTRETMDGFDTGFPGGCGRSVSMIHIVCKVTGDLSKELDHNVLLHLPREAR